MHAVEKPKEHAVDAEAFAQLTELQNQATKKLATTQPVSVCRHAAPISIQQPAPLSSAGATRAITWTRTMKCMCVCLHAPSSSNQCHSSAEQMRATRPPPPPPPPPPTHTHTHTDYTLRRAAHAPTSSSPSKMHTSAATTPKTGAAMTPARLDG